MNLTHRRRWLLQDRGADAAAELWRSGRGREVAWPAYAEYRHLNSSRPRWCWRRRTSTTIPLTRAPGTSVPSVNAATCCTIGRSTAAVAGSRTVQPGARGSVARPLWALVTAGEGCARERDVYGKIVGTLGANGRGRERWSRISTLTHSMFWCTKP